MKIDLSLANVGLYAGCEIEEVAGRGNLKTPVAAAVGIVGRNIAAIVADTPAADRGTVTLTGPMAVWSYLVVFHAVVHVFSRVEYDDGRSGAVLIAAHGPPQAPDTQRCDERDMRLSAGQGGNNADSLPWKYRND